MADRKRGSEEGEGARGGVAGGGKGDSKPFGHEMMLKEVKLLESVENEGPEGLRVKVERVRVGDWGHWGVGVSGWGCWGDASGPAGLCAVTTGCCAGFARAWLGSKSWLCK